MDSGSTAVMNAAKSRFSNVDRRLEAWNRATGCSLNPALPQSPLQRLAPTFEAPQPPHKPSNPALLPQTPSPRLAPRTRDYDVVSRLKDQPRALLDLETCKNPALEFPAAVTVRDPWVPCSAPVLRTANTAASDRISPVLAPVVEVNGFSKLQKSNGEQVRACCLANDRFDSKWDRVEDAADAADSRGDVAGEPASKQSQVLPKEGDIAHRRGPASLAPLLSLRSRLFSADAQNVSPQSAEIERASNESAAVKTAFAQKTPSPETDEPITLDVKGVEMRGRPLYLDMQATSPVDPRVLDAMLPFFTEQYGNPHSRTHLYGWESEGAVEAARQQVASLIGASPKEIIFTSGATESNNIAIKGVAHFYKDKKKHVITTQTEHKCVLDSCRHLQQEGFDVTYLPVGSDGLIDLETLKAAIRPDTVLVSIMTVNNEIGVIQPLAEIGQLCRENKIFFHTDAAQAAGKIPLSVDELNIDLLSLSSHKIYGPKGVGALYVRRRPRVRLEPQMSGGGQERGLRSGTVPTPLVVGLGAACAVAEAELERDFLHAERLKQRLLKGITSQLEGVVINGSDEPGKRYPGNLNLSFAYVEGESLLMGLKEIAVSSGSACTSASLEPSYVLRALGVEEEMAHTSIRFGFGRFTTEEEVDRAVALTVHQVQRLRDMSPLWEMVQEGIDIKTIQWSQH
ncbi:unnamed protein product [Closterium sp. NIES-54]